MGNCIESEKSIYDVTSDSGFHITNISSVIIKLKLYRLAISSAVARSLGKLCLPGIPLRTAFPGLDVIARKILIKLESTKFSRRCLRTCVTSRTAGAYSPVRVTSPESDVITSSTVDVNCISLSELFSIFFLTNFSFFSYWVYCLRWSFVIPYKMFLFPLLPSLQTVHSVLLCSKLTITCHGLDGKVTGRCRENVLYFWEMTLRSIL